MYDFYDFPHPLLTIKFSLIAVFSITALSTYLWFFLISLSFGSFSSPKQPQISEFNKKLRFLNEWKAVEECYIKRWKDEYVEGAMRQRSGPTLPVVPPSVSIVCLF